VSCWPKAALTSKPARHLAQGVAPAWQACCCLDERRLLRQGLQRAPARNEAFAVAARMAGGTTPILGLNVTPQLKTLPGAANVPKDTLKRETNATAGRSTHHIPGQGLPKAQGAGRNRLPSDAESAGIQAIPSSHTAVDKRGFAGIGFQAGRRWRCGRIVSRVTGSYPQTSEGSAAVARRPCVEQAMQTD